MSNYSDFQTQRNQTINKTKQQINFKITRMIQDSVGALIKFIKQMLAAVLGK
jgi:hypothetical protein